MSVVEQQQAAMSTGPTLESSIDGAMRAIELCGEMVLYCVLGLMVLVALLVTR
jgi:hypothetical protein